MLLSVPSSDLPEGPGAGCPERWRETQTWRAQARCGHQGGSLRAGLRGLWGSGLALGHLICPTSERDRHRTEVIFGTSARGLTGPSSAPHLGW